MACPLRLQGQCSRYTRTNGLNVLKSRNLANIFPFYWRLTWQEKNGMSVCLVSATACPPSCRSNTRVCCDMTQMGYAFCTNVVWHEWVNFLGSSGLGNCPVFPSLSACNPLFPFLHPFHSHKAFFHIWVELQCSGELIPEQIRSAEPGSYLGCLLSASSFMKLSHQTYNILL